jgi:hypothetical protein
MVNENFIRYVLPGSSTAIGGYCHDDLENRRHKSAESLLRFPGL